jgi:hypothetical protein
MNEHEDTPAIVAGAGMTETPPPRSDDPTVTIHHVVHGLQRHSDRHHVVRPPGKAEASAVTRGRHAECSDHVGSDASAHEPVGRAAHVRYRESKPR